MNSLMTRSRLFPAINNLVDEVWAKDRLGLFNVPVTMLDETEYAPASHDPNQLELPIDMPVTMEQGALDVQVGGGHYKDMAIQPVEFIEANNLPFLEGCVVKRVCRHANKNGAEDIRKAIHELNLILQLRYGLSE